MEKLIKHHTVRTTLMSLGGLLVLTALVAANPMAMPDAMSPPGDMMIACQAHCQKSTTGTDPMTTPMDTTEPLYEAAQMRAILAQTQPPLTEDHMTMCMNMMSRMQQMHGGMNGHTNEKP